MMRIALGQINALVGDLAANADKMRNFYAKALEENVDLLVFPELSLCGYPPEDLLLKNHFLEDNSKTIAKLAADCPQITTIVGFAESYKDGCYNSAAVLKDGCVNEIYRKGKLPNFSVFDEKRYFNAGCEPVVIDVNGFNIALTICADIWDIEWLTEFLKNKTPLQMILNISASPFYAGKTKKRKQVIRKCVEVFDCTVCYCNTVGGQDELVFDGRSIISDRQGEIITMAKAFEEDMLIVDFEMNSCGEIKITPAVPPTEQPGTDIEEVYHALVLGTRDYAKKNGFKKLLLGLSGGIDSSVTAAIAAAAMGCEKVIGVTMPTKFNSLETISDAGLLAENLGIEFFTIPIGPMLDSFDKALEQIPGWDNKGIAYENLQARIRGDCLMSLSNRFGSLVLTAGNKSETAVGYTTLYGDTAGGFAVIKDVPKTKVYQLAEYINKINNRAVIPVDIIQRPPTAELRENQKDTDSLPDYDLLDRVLEDYVEEDKSAQQLIDAGLPKDVVNLVIRMVDRNEYKRRQSPPGIKITPKAFGRDRRLPITNHYSSCDDN